MTKAILLITSILMTMFYCGMSSTEPDSVGYLPVPDSVYDYFGPGYSPDYHNLGERVRFKRYNCPNKIVQVTSDNFAMCYLKNPISVLSDDTFLFDKLGDYFFICDEKLCFANEVRYLVRIGHYEPNSTASAPENYHITPASAPAPISPSPSPSEATPISPSPSPSPSEATPISPSPSPSPSEATDSPPRKLRFLFN